MIIDLSLSIVRGLTQFVKTFITINGNDITIFGTPLTFELIRGAPANDPTFILGSNGSAPTKSPATATGRALIAGPTQGDSRKAINLRASTSVGNSFLEHFINIANMDGGLLAATTGGSNTNVAVDGRSGVVRLATGVSVTASRRASITSNLQSVALGFGRSMFFAPVKLEGTLLDGVTLTGRISIGFIDNAAAALSADGVFFKHEGGNWFATCRASTIETSVDTGVAATLGTWIELWVDVNAAGTEAKFYIDGTLVATTVDNIPIGAGQQTGYGIHILRSTAVATDVQIDADFYYVRLDNPAQMPFGI